MEPCTASGETCALAKARRRRDQWHISRRPTAPPREREEQVVIRNIVTLGAIGMLAACAAATRPASTASTAPTAKGPGAGKGYNHDPYPSTYRAYPGVATMVTNVTILDGEGGRINGGSVLFRDGKIVAAGVGLPVEPGVTVIDGTGKYL